MPDLSKLNYVDPNAPEVIVVPDNCESPPSESWTIRRLRQDLELTQKRSDEYRVGAEFLEAENKKLRVEVKFAAIGKAILANDIWSRTEMVGSSIENNWILVSVVNRMSCFPIPLPDDLDARIAMFSRLLRIPFEVIRELAKEAN